MLNGFSTLTYIHFLSHSYHFIIMWRSCGDSPKFWRCLWHSFVLFYVRLWLFFFLLLYFLFEINWTLSFLAVSLLWYRLFVLFNSSWDALGALLRWIASFECRKGKEHFILRKIIELNKKCVFPRHLINFF